jgi:hypothetical protein
MRRNGVVIVAIAILAATFGGGCDEANSDAEERGEAAVELCEGRGGVAAFDDDIAICRDHSVHHEADSETAEERGRAAAELCLGQGGVTAFDDDIVICRDQSVHEGEL